MVDLTPRRPPLVLAVHGTHDPDGIRTSGELRALVAGRLPGVQVHLGWADLLTPTLTQTLELLGHCVVVPVFLTTGYHVVVDIPAAVEASGRRARVTGRVGDGLVPALADRVAEAGGHGDAVVLAAAGSRRAASVREVHSAAERLAVLLGVPVEPAFLTAAEPTVPAALASLAARGLDDVVVASYLLAPGAFHTRLRGLAPGRVTAPLGAHPLLVEAIVERYTREQAFPAESVVDRSPTAGDDRPDKETVHELVR